MGESNGTWGEVVEHDPEMGEVWDRMERLPDEGENPALDAFLARKGISLGSLLRQGARITDARVLVFPYNDGLKYRDLIDGKRWNYIGSTFAKMKLVKAQEGSDTVLVCEGETDGAWLSDNYPQCDVAIMPAGALHFPASYAAQISPYARVLVCLDNDEAGEAGAAKISQALPHAQMFFPPAGVNDWCELGADRVPELPDPEDAPARLDTIVFGGDLLELEVPEIASWFEGALLPIGGQLILHGWAKSFKSFMGLGILSSLSQGQPWLGFEPTEEPCKTCVIQFEIPWAYYRDRVEHQRQGAADVQLWDENFGTFSPLVRPTFRAGDTASEDVILKALTDANVQVVMFDPIRRAIGMADLNAENEVRKILYFFERLQREGITVIATHHDNKDGGRDGGGDSMSMTGSGAFAGDCDSLLSISRPKGFDETDPRRNVRFLLRNGPSPSVRGFELIDGRVQLAAEPWGGAGADDEDEAEFGNEPAI